MNISQFATACEVSTDTVRYYEKQGLIKPATRQTNGYRKYGDADVQALRFVRGAQALGFSLAEILAIMPRLAGGKFARADIEQQLLNKMAQIDEHMRQLKILKKELQTTFASLTCQPELPVTTTQSTATDSGSGAGAAMVKQAFKKPATKRFKKF
ncbi:MerR family transcriptional regulator [Undibacterium sp. Di27W]|uniref:MerR family transcriptional regulator n=1 Tax=Undibacterium sp. Di27W TaxID=3413036 RepID=UPI003BF2B6D6